MTLAEELLPSLIVTVYPTELAAPLVLVRDPGSGYLSRSRNEDPWEALEEACAKLVRYKANSMRLVR